MLEKKLKIRDNITERGFIHNTYCDRYNNQYRIIQSSSLVKGVIISGDTVMDGSSTIVLLPKEIKKFIK